MNKSVRRHRVPPGGTRRRNRLHSSPPIRGNFRR
ncbi:hypothetical protein RHECNPAF_4310059 [Rhizobium etli CNPAF512]|nr:hypothetical protein RHECNPAF_4310059 [Rhizobium etli CNPAF512]